VPMLSLGRIVVLGVGEALGGSIFAVVPPQMSSVGAGVWPDEPLKGGQELANSVWGGEAVPGRYCCNAGHCRRPY
jgi:hypothetical protein